MADEKKTNDGPGKLRFLTELIEMAITLATAVMVFTGNKQVHEANTWEDKKKVAVEHFPKWFGTHSDEGIWVSIRPALKKPVRIGLDKILSKLTSEERDAFAKNVDSAPRAVTINAQGNEESVREFSAKDPRVMFLKYLVTDANMCATDTDVEMAVNTLRVNRLLEESRISKIQKASGSTAAKFLGVASVEDLADPAKVVEAINVNFRSKIQAKRKKVFKRGIIGWIFQL